MHEGKQGPHKRRSWRPFSAASTNIVADTQSRNVRGLRLCRGEKPRCLCCIQHSDGVQTSQPESIALDLPAHESHKVEASHRPDAWGFGDSRVVACRDRLMSCSFKLQHVGQKGCLRTITARLLRFATAAVPSPCRLLPYAARRRRRSEGAGDLHAKRSESRLRARMPPRSLTST